MDALLSPLVCLAAAKAPWRNNLVLHWVCFVCSNRENRFGRSTNHGCRECEGLEARRGVRTPHHSWRRPPSTESRRPIVNH